MLISEKKVEIILKQVSREHWPRLCYDKDEVGAIFDLDNDDNEGGAFCSFDDD